MCYNTFDTGFDMMSDLNSGFVSPIFNGTGCFPVPGIDMGYNVGFNQSFDSGFGTLPITCGYSPAPFGCNPASMDFNENVCIDGIPITPSTPPAWMATRAAQAEMHLNQLEMHLNDPNLWMNFIPPSSFNPPMFDWSSVDWQSTPIDSPTDSSIGELPFALNQITGINSQTGMDISQPNGIESSTPIWRDEEVLACGLTQNQYDQSLSKYHALLSDCERQLENCEPYHSAQRAMIQNNIDRIHRNIRDLDKPLGKI